MAKGDVKSSHRSYGRASYSYNYDDQGRGKSKSYWESFISFFDHVEDKEAWLLNMADAEHISKEGYGDKTLYNNVVNMTWRHNIHDWAFRRYDDEDNNDGRVRRAVVKACGENVWHKLQARAKRIVDERVEQERLEQAQRSEEWENEQRSFKAERIKREQEAKQLLMKNIDLVTGAIKADFAHSLSFKERYAQDEGEWLDNPVSGLVTGYGFGEEHRQEHGIKVQITIALDCSNSMIYNRVHEVAGTAFRDIFMALEQIQAEHPNDMYVAAFEFSKDGYEASDRGRVADILGYNDWGSNFTKVEYSPQQLEEGHVGVMERYKATDKWGWRSTFSGEDTWFYPLFEKIEKWENKFSDPGAVRLDIVLTDAVIEHPSDIRRSDEIQERRNGNLQTAMLNFMPEQEWAGSDLPLRCVQYPANPDNIGGLLRNIISEFLTAYV